MLRRTTAVFGATAIALLTLVVPVSALPEGPGVTTRAPLVTRLKGVGDATQVISVTTASYGSTTATVRAFAKRNGHWHLVHGPYSAWIGYNGFAPPGSKREGDGRTPSGSYPFSYFFGDDARPTGIHYKWRHATSHDFWDDDPSSARYNEWVDRQHHSAGRDPEPLYTLPSYADVAVINYNASRTPGLGSAIFLHVTHHSATSGCVALPRPDVLTLLRWLRPAAHARIIMGTTATVTR
jgi:L,D-peptidoglycan transpeptidase YkuD (ErfK/YbiS/YcfS/YnhG family)